MHGGNLGKRGPCPSAIGRTRSGLTSKLHVVYDAQGQPLTFFLSAGQMDNAKGALALVSQLPLAKGLIAVKGYDAGWFRKDLTDRGVATCIPSRRGRKALATHHRKLYRQRHKVENIFARLEHWCRITIRYDRCGELFLSVIALADAVIWWM